MKPQDDPARDPGESEDEKAVAMLLESLRKVRELREAMQRFRVLEKSALSGDDAATAYETLSSQVETNIQGAMDNINALGELVLNAHMLPAFAHFGLLRNALEMVGMGLWLLGPNTRDERVLRSLQAALEARRDHFNAVAEIGGEAGAFPTTDLVKLMLETQRDARPGLRGASLNVPSISSRLRGAQHYCSEGEYTLLGLWRLTSGAMHGRRAILKDLLEHEVIDSSESEVRARATSGVVVVANVARHVEIHLFDLVFLLLARAGHRSAAI